MTQRRLARLNEQIKREISSLLRSEVRDPRIGSPTVTEVQVTADLWLARVYVRPSPIDQEEHQSTEALLNGLENAAPFIRRGLGKVLTVRRVPELRFILDRTLEDATRIEEILREVAATGEGGSTSERSEEARDSSPESDTR
jgi:ribosome-binding factor A